MEKANKRSSISQKAKDVIMELFGILFGLVVDQFGEMEIKDSDLAEWEEWKELDVYPELELIAKNPVRLKVQEFLDNYGLTVESITKMGNIQTININGIYDQNVKIEAVLLVLVEDGKMKLVGHRILRMVRIRKY